MLLKPSRIIEGKKKQGDAKEEEQYNIIITLFVFYDKPIRSPLIHRVPAGSPFAVPCLNILKEKGMI